MVLLGVETDLSTRTRSSLSRAHLALGHITHTRLPASRSSSWCSAWASWLTVCTHGDEPQPPRPHTSGPHGSDLTSDLTLMLFLSSEPSVRMKASLPSVPSTLRKQLVVCPIPDGRTLSHSMALITELLPLLVLKNGGGNRFHWEAEVSRPWVVTEERPTSRRRPPSCVCAPAPPRCRPPWPGSRRPPGPAPLW